MRPRGATTEAALSLLRSMPSRAQKARNRKGGLATAAKHGHALAVARGKLASHPKRLARHPDAESGSDTCLRCGGSGKEPGGEGRA